MNVVLSATLHSPWGQFHHRWAALRKGCARFPEEIENSLEADVLTSQIRTQLAFGLVLLIVAWFGTALRYSPPSWLNVDTTPSITHHSFCGFSAQSVARWLGAPYGVSIVACWLVMETNLLCQMLTSIHCMPYLFYCSNDLLTSTYLKIRK